MASGRLIEAADLLPPLGSSPDPRVEIIRSRIQADKGETAEAINTLRQLIDQFPEYAPAQLFSGIFHWDLNQHQEALACFDQSLTIHKQNELARSYRALCLCALNKHDDAAAIWHEHGFSDNSMFRVRTAEHVEKSWLFDKSFMSEKAHAEPTPQPRFSQRKALRYFYRRDFREMLNYLPPAPTDNELQAFLAATAHEMLRQYGAAEAYIQPFLERRAEWPDPLIALNARLLVRRGKIAAAAREFASVVIMGPEDFGVNYYMGIICLAYEKPIEARQYFLRAFTDYMVDTLEFQWWQIEQVLLEGDSSSQ